MKVHGFLVSVELEPNGRSSPEQVASRIADAARYMDDVGEITCDHLGMVDVVDEQDQSWGV